MTTRVHNFNAGPSAVPLDVLEKIKSEMLSYKNSGMSLLEMSHRSKEFELCIDLARSTLRELMAIPDDYEILFLQGGASLQFSMIPMNMVLDSQSVDVVLTGSWTKKAFSEHQKLVSTRIVKSSEDAQFSYIPDMSDYSPPSNLAYLYLTSNNTIFGTQWKDFSFLGVPLVVDMSSDILSREIDVSNFNLIFAGAQKNLGVAGVTVVILKKDLLNLSSEELPSMLSYAVHAKASSLYNTPPTFSIYVLGLVLDWIRSQGGVKEVAAKNQEKSTYLYDYIDESEGFYNSCARSDSRSDMNVVFRIKGGNDDLETRFIQEAEEKGFIGLKGHRSVGGCRASLYNAVSLDSVESLVAFMKTFQKWNN